ncbi:unnamed protein product [Protopolystoma xenopodis]|uniref:Uncharacterized protein n=1 Tax=Protopolystoma xenopodis TaxID=117903 RepID=A0A448WI81_9PLAT|nr:unnamed protein product [Protopolystoma xenopodis]
MGKVGEQKNSWINVFSQCDHFRNSLCNLKFIRFLVQHAIGLCPHPGSTYLAAVLTTIFNEGHVGPWLKAHRSCLSVAEACHPLDVASSLANSVGSGGWRIAAKVTLIRPDDAETSECLCPCMGALS